MYNGKTSNGWQAGMRRSLTILVLFVGCTKNPDQSRPTAQSKKSAERIADVGGVDNVGKISDALFRGGQPDDDGFKYLREKGIKTIINLRENHSDKDGAEKLGLKCVDIPMKAGVLGSKPPTDEQIKKFFEIVLDPAYQPVYFHCKQGMDRTGTMAAIYRIEMDGWTNQEAINEMQEFGYHDVYKDLIEFVRNYKPRGYGKK